MRNCRINECHSAFQNREHVTNLQMCFSYWKRNIFPLLVASFPSYTINHLQVLDRQQTVLFSAVIHRTHSPVYHVAFLTEHFVFRLPLAARL